MLLLIGGLIGLGDFAYLAMVSGGDRTHWVDWERVVLLRVVI